MDEMEEMIFVQHERISKKPELRTEHVRKKNLEKYAKDFAHVYNSAGAQHNDGKSINDAVAIKIFKSMKAIMDEEPCWLAHENDAPLGCWINLPDLNFYFKELRGKLGWFQKLKFLYVQKTKS